MPVEGCLRPGIRNPPALQKIALGSAGHDCRLKAFRGGGFDFEKSGRVRDHIGCGCRLVVADVVDGMLIRALQGCVQQGNDVIHVNPRKCVVALFDPAGAPCADPIER